MKKLRIVLKPLEPYFFGNDRNLRYQGTKHDTKAANYYAISEKLPSQTTLFGILRTMGIVQKNADYSLSESDQRNIGTHSYNLLGTDEREDEFGRIKSISSLYLFDGNDYYVRTPYDHNILNATTKYAPFSAEDYKEVSTSVGNRLLPIAYPVKNGFTRGYTNCRTCECISDEAIFEPVDLVGINKGNEQIGKSYFRKVFISMQGYSFCFFADMDDDFCLSNDTVVYAGTGKSSFGIAIDEVTEEEIPDVSWLFPQKIRDNVLKVVTLSDTYIRDDIADFYQNVLYANTSTKEFRVFVTNYGQQQQVNRFRKGEEALLLLEAGSTFLVEEAKMEAFENMMNQGHSKIAGFNNYRKG